MEDLICKLNACSYDELNKHTRLFNINTLEYFLYIYLDPTICRDLELYQVDEILPDKKELPIKGIFDRDRICWIKAKSDILNKKPGKHIYKLSMINKITNDVAPLYFSYIIQDDNPDKPYKYMESESKSSCTCSNCSKCS